MRKGFILLLLAMGELVCAQSTPFPIPSREQFINQVFHTVVDSSFSAYYLSAEAAPCSFVKYDYGEWVKYHLQEDVPIYILNELAGKCYHDRGRCYWQQDSLIKAFCIDSQMTDSLLFSPDEPHRNNPLTKKQRKALRQKKKAIAPLPPEKGVVFSFSRPEFTDDGQYAIIDMSFTCGPLCGRSVTYLFRLVGSSPSGWKMIGKKLNWVS